MEVRANFVVIINALRSFIIIKKNFIMKKLSLFSTFCILLLLAGTPVENAFKNFGEKSEVKQFSSAEEVREFPKGKLELIKIGGATMGRATLLPGWTWSSSVQPLAKTKSCEAPHFQYHASGTLMVKMDDGTMYECKAGDVSLLSKGHDAWVVGNEPVVVIDFQGMVDYAKGMK